MMQIAERLKETNVSHPERWASVIAGAAIAAYGITRRSLGGAITAAIGGALVMRGTTGFCPLYRALGLSMNCDENAEESDGRNVSVPYGRGIRVERSVTVDSTPGELYAFWRDFANLPRFMSHLEAVRVYDAKRSHWIAKAPFGRSVEWDAEIINEIPNELIGWRSVEGSDVDNAGSVHFTPATAGRGTEVKVVLRYDPPAGVLGAAVAKLFGEEPSRQVQEDLRAFKQIIEAGEKPRIK